MKLPVEKVRKIMKIAKEPISLETPIGEEEDSHLGDFIEDKKVASPLESAIRKNLHHQVRRVLNTLTEREKKYCAGGLVSASRLTTPLRKSGRSLT